MAVCLFSCKKVELDAQKVTKLSGFNQNFNYTITIIDSCEYIAYRTYAYKAVTHKGNCKFCTERNKAIIKQLLKEQYETQNR